MNRIKMFLVYAFSACTSCKNPSTRIVSYVSSHFYVVLDMFISYEFLSWKPFDLILVHCSCILFSLKTL